VATMIGLRYRTGEKRKECAQAAADPIDQDNELGYGVRCDPRKRKKSQQSEVRSAKSTRGKRR